MGKGLGGRRGGRGKEGRWENEKGTFSRIASSIGVCDVAAIRKGELENEV